MEAAADAGADAASPTASGPLSARGGRERMMGALQRRESEDSSSPHRSPNRSPRRVLGGGTIVDAPLRPTVPHAPMDPHLVLKAEVAAKVKLYAELQAKADGLDDLLKGEGVQKSQKKELKAELSSFAKELKEAKKVGQKAQKALAADVEALKSQESWFGSGNGGIPSDEPADGKGSSPSRSKPAAAAAGGSGGEHGRLEVDRPPSQHVPMDPDESDEAWRGIAREVHRLRLKTGGDQNAPASLVELLDRHDEDRQELMEVLMLIMLLLLLLVLLLTTTRRTG